MPWHTFERCNRCAGGTLSSTARLPIAQGGDAFEGSASDKMSKVLQDSAIRVEAIASRLEAIAGRFEAIALRVEPIASRLEAIALRVEAIALRFLWLVGWRPLQLETLLLMDQTRSFEVLCHSAPKLSRMAMAQFA